MLLKIFQYLDIFGSWILPLIIIAFFRSKLCQISFIFLIFIVAGILSLDLIIHSSSIFLNLRKPTYWFDPNVSGVFFIFVYLFHRNTHVIRNKKINLVLTFLLYGLIFLSRSIEAIFLLFLIFYSSKAKKLFLFLITIFFSFIFYLNRQEIIRSIKIRLAINHITLLIIGNIKKGIGIGNYSNFFPNFRTFEYILLKGTSIIENDPHNLILNLFCTFGVVVGFILLFALIYFFVEYFKKTRDLSVLLIYGLHSLVGINSMFINSIFGVVTANKLKSSEATDNLGQKNDRFQEKLKSMFKK